MIDPAFDQNRILGQRLRNLVDPGGVALPAYLALEMYSSVHARAGASQAADVTVDVVVSTNEINDQHGTGPLVKRIFEGRRNVFSIRSKNDWGGHEFGDWDVCIPQAGRPRPECFRRVLNALGNRRVKQVLCVPFLRDELETAIAVKEGYGARLCLYLMDDQNVAARVIPDELMREFLGKCSLRLATHPELRAAYERKYGLKFYLLPAVVPEALVAAEPVQPPPDRLDPRRGVLIGSFWDQAWFDRTCEVFAGCDVSVDWYGSNWSPWLKFPAEELARAGIRALGLVPEPELAGKLRRYPYVIVPVSAFDEKERNTGVARLSLPGRILFAVATAHIPVLVIGSDQTCGARFVQHFGLGEVVPYESEAVAAAIHRLSEPAVQREIRRRAAALGPRFSSRGISEWLAESIDRGEAADARFEEIFADYPADGAPGARSGEGGEPADGNHVV